MSLARIGVLAGLSIAVLFPGTSARSEEMTDVRSPRVVASGRDDATSWRGWVVSPKGRVFRADETRFDEKSAKFAAKGVCEKKGGRTCDPKKAIAVPETGEWIVTAVACNRGGKKAYFLGGSALGGAWDKAMDKANEAGFRAADCEEIALRNTE